MTYFEVLFTFIVPPLAVLAVWVIRHGIRRDDRSPLTARQVLLLQVFLALVYTTPWDNYLVATGVWWYDPDLVTGITLGYVPLEEYTFFVLQSLLTGLWTLAVLEWLSPHAPPFQPDSRLRKRAGVLVALVWAASTLVLISGWQPGTYLSLILSWALVPIFIQVAFGGDILKRSGRSLIVGILAPTLYLWWIDSLAITAGTWVIDPAQTTGIRLGSLPIEEMLFFFMTNMIIAFGTVLLLAPESRARAVEMARRFGSRQNDSRVGK